MKNKIPYFSFEKMHNEVANELFASTLRVIESNWYILGKELERFEQSWSKYSNSTYSIGVNSGLDALTIALKCLDIGKGDEVIVASNAYIACWNAIHHTGAKIIPVEPDPYSSNLDPDKIEAKITQKTKAIMPVHLYGQVCEMGAILSIAKKYKIFVVEDNSQSQGARYKGRKTGTMGHINATSFYPTKNLGALGDAGIINTENHSYKEKAKMLRNYGSNSKYFSSKIGFNSRMDEIQAAILNVKLKRLDQWNEERIQIAKIYNSKLKSIPGLKLPKITSDGSHVYHIYCIHCPQRNDLKNYLLKKGIQTSIHYPLPPHLQKAYQFLAYQKGDFPIAEKLANQALSLPIYPGLNEGDIERITFEISQFYSMHPISDN